MNNSQKTPAIVRTVVGIVILLIIGVFVYKSSTNGNLNTINAGDVTKVIYPVYVDDNGKAGSSHDIVFSGIGSSYTVSIVRIGEAKSGSDPVEKFWIESFEYTDSSQQDLKVHIVGTFGVDGHDTRTFDLKKVDGKLLVTAEPAL